MSDEWFRRLDGKMDRMGGEIAESSKKLDRIEKSIDTHVREIALHTASLPSISATLEQQREDNSDLVSILAKHRSVPLHVFLVVILILGAVIVMDKSANTKTGLTMTPDKVQIGPVTNQ